MTPGTKCLGLEFGHLEKVRRAVRPPGAERSQAHCIIGVPPVFPICAKGDDQKLESQTLLRSQSQMRSCHSTNTATQARRLCYFSLGVAARRDELRARRQ